MLSWLAHLQRLRAWPGPAGTAGAAQQRQQREQPAVGVRREGRGGLLAARRAAVLRAISASPL